MFVLNFYSPVFVDQLKRGRKTATIRLGDKGNKYRKGEVVMITVGFQHSPRQKIFDAVIDSVEVKRVQDLSPRRKVEMDDMVTVVRFSQISDRPSEIHERMRPSAPAQN